ncbi:nuclease-related domain-containing protein [Leifsonia sp. SIMBA_070]|uniref:nuclease-related domain-containing protein n=1 Tax=Leifsonia sp. SIMBA_070 TaxID=3085810 RepID=UPI003978B271
MREAHPRIGGLLLAITDEPQSTKAWATGAAGEILLGRRLDSLLNDSTFVLHDRRIPPTKANIDHIVVSSSGVFVIDAKKYKGRPSLRVDGGLFRPRVERLMVGSRDQTKLVDGINGQVSKVRAALAAADLGDVPVTGMLCFVEADWPLFGGDFSIMGIRVLWPKKAASEIAACSPADPDVGRRTYRAIAQAFPIAQS